MMSMQWMNRQTLHRICQLALAGACVLTGACSTMHGGYPNHLMAPSLDGPTKPVTNDQAMYMDLIERMQQQHSYYASLAHIDAYQLRYGSSPKLQLLRADALREIGHGTEAGAIYQTLVQGPQAAPAWHGLGLIAAAQERYDDAEKDLQQAVQREPINVMYLNDLGYARLAAGNLATAHEPLAEAAELEPTNTKVISNLALWALLEGDDGMGQAIMQRANLPPENRDAIQKMAAQLHARAITRAVAAATPTVPANHTAAITGTPAMLLDRFGNASASSESTP